MYVGSFMTLATSLEVPPWVDGWPGGLPGGGRLKIMIAKLRLRRSINRRVINVM